MYDKLNQCPVCENRSLENKLICKDYLVSKESFAIVECTACGVRLTNPFPIETELEKFYQSEDYASHQTKRKSLMDVLYSIVRWYALRKKEKQIKKLFHSISSSQKEKSLLDIGCGNGDFIRLCQRKGWKIKGVEPNPKAREVASQKTGQIIEKNIQLIENQQFGLISCWHSLEHVPHINETIKKCYDLLIKDGIMVIALPNYMCYDAQLYKEYWAGYDVPRHLYHFEKNSVKKLLKKHKLKLIHTLPMKWDAYYVSLLSEKYKNGKLHYFQGFLNGWKSNRWASKHEHNYSSLIYIAKK